MANLRIISVSVNIILLRMDYSNEVVVEEVHCAAARTLIYILQEFSLLIQFVFYELLCAIQVLLLFLLRHTLV